MSFTITDRTGTHRIDEKHVHPELAALLREHAAENPGCAVYGWAVYTGRAVHSGYSFEVDSMPPELNPKELWPIYMGLWPDTLNPQTETQP